MHQAEITTQIDHWLNEGFDVQALLNQVVTIRTGMAEIRVRNDEWKTNNKYIFGVKRADECYDDNWKWFCISIVADSYWTNNQHIEDRHLSGEIHLPPGFSEEMEGAFSFDAERGERETVISLLTEAGFRHSEALQEWMMRHDP